MLTTAGRWKHNETSMGGRSQRDFESNVFSL